MKNLTNILLTCVIALLITDLNKPQEIQVVEIIKVIETETETVGITTPIIKTVEVVEPLVIEPLVIEPFETLELIEPLEVEPLEVETVEVEPLETEPLETETVYPTWEYSILITNIDNQIHGINTVDDREFIIDFFELEALNIDASYINVEDTVLISGNNETILSIVK